jgi:hypothetical protein
MFHVRQHERIGRPRMSFVVHQQIRFSDSVSELHNFQLESVQPNALIAILSKDQRLAVFKLNHVFAARFFFGHVVPCTVVKNIAVLQNLD